MVKVQNIVKELHTKVLLPILCVSFYVFGNYVIRENMEAKFLSSQNLIKYTSGKSERDE